MLDRIHLIQARYRAPGLRDNGGKRPAVVGTLCRLFASFLVGAICARRPRATGATQVGRLRAGRPVVGALLEDAHLPLTVDALQAAGQPSYGGLSSM